MSGDITRTRSTHKGRHRQSSSVTTKGTANRLTRNSTLGASVWAPTVGFATLGVATVAAMTMVSLDQSPDPGSPAQAIGAAETVTPQAQQTPAGDIAASKPAEAAGAPRTRNVSMVMKVADASSAAKRRAADITVTTHRATKVVTKAVPKTNPAPAPVPKGDQAPPKSGGDGSGGSTGGGAGDTPAPAPVTPPPVGVDLPTGTGTSVDLAGLVHIGL